MKTKRYILLITLNLILCNIENVYSQGEEHEINAFLRFEMSHRLKLGNFKVESYYKYGKLDSVYRAWNADGDLVTLGYYNQGLKDGFWTEWFSRSGNFDFVRYKYSNGKLLETYQYKSFHDDTTKTMSETYIDYLEEGGRVEKRYGFHQNSIKADEITAYFDSDGNFTRNFKAWDENGTLFIEENIKNRKQHGVQKEWDAEGNLILEEYYDMGKLIKKVK